MTVIDLEQQLRQVLAELELVSHVDGRDYASLGMARSTDEPEGGARPPGGDFEPRKTPEERDDYRASFMQKGASYFRWRIERAAGREEALLAILVEAHDCLQAWKKQPQTDGTPEPQRWTFEWRRRIAWEVHTGARSIVGAAQYYSINERSVRNYRDQFDFGNAEDLPLFAVGCDNCGFNLGRLKDGLCRACREFAAVRASGEDPFDTEAQDAV